MEFSQSKGPARQRCRAVCYKMLSFGKRGKRRRAEPDEQFLHKCLTRNVEKCRPQSGGYIARRQHPLLLHTREAREKNIKRWLVSLAGLTAVCVFVIYRLQTFDLDIESRGQAIAFKSGGDQLEGTLLMPRDRQAPPVVLIVHGDGAQDRWSDGGYAALINFLLSQGIAVFSWDKPGVGASQGNWLAQTMDERAEEAAQALQRLRSVPSLKSSPMGFLGFSQAGWVVPQASALAHADFTVLVGPAINWRDQGFYYLSQKLRAQKVSPGQIAKQVRREANAFDAEFTQAVAESPCAAVCTREDFERRNALADARSAISLMHTPVMVLMGEDDRNVDPDETLNT